MGNTRHPECAIRNLAREAKSRLQCNRYGETAAAPEARPRADFAAPSPRVRSAVRRTRKARVWKITVNR